MRLLALLVCGWTLCATVDAAEGLPTAVDEIATNVQGMLASPSARDRSWGAHCAGHSQREALLAALRASAAEDGDEADLAIESIADALIRLDIPPDGDDLDLLVARSQATAAMILAVRHRQHSQAWLRRRAQEDVVDAHWLAIMGALVDLRDPPDIQRLLDELRLRLIVQVHDGEAPGRYASVRMADGHVRGYRGFPARIVYTLHRQARSGTVCIVAAPQAFQLHYTRHQRGGAGEGIGFGNQGIVVDRHHARIAFLRSLLNWQDGEAELQARELLPVRSGSADRILDAVRIGRERMSASYRSLVDALVRRRLVDADPEAEVPLVVDLEDHRQDRSAPLPNIDG